MNAHYDYFASAAKTTEPILEDELKDIGASRVKQTRGGVFFSGDFAMGYKACLWSRVATRVLVILSRGKAETREDLYRLAYAVDWYNHFTLRETFAVQCAFSDARGLHTNFAALVVKDAIADYFRKRFGRRPDVNTENPNIRIEVYLSRGEAVLSLDLSGESLHRRGYRVGAGPAPIKENTAAAFLYKAGWPEIAASGGSLVDLMCGAGTLLIEGAWMACHAAPGLKRSSFGFERWKQHNSLLWREVRETAERRLAHGLTRMPKILGFDDDLRAVETALKNIAFAGMKDYIRVTRKGLEHLDAGDAEGLPPGLVAVNPPYGVRMGGGSNLGGLYKRLGETVWRLFPGARLAVITGEPALFEHIPLTYDKENVLYNGAIRCEIRQYPVNPPERPEGEESEAGEEMFRNRIRKNLKNLKSFIAKEKLSSYRVYDADMPDYAVAIDLFEQKWVHIQEYAAPAEIPEAKARKRLQFVVDAAPELLHVDKVHVFVKQRVRQKGRSQYEQLDETGRYETIREGGYQFLVNFTDHLDPGIFLDNRLVRKMIGASAASRRFLNLYCYTGTATVYAAGGGAVASVSVDTSNTYLTWAERNMELNGLSGPLHKFVRMDGMEWLDGCIAGGGCSETFDLVFADPPTFSNTKKEGRVFDVQKDHPALITKIFKVLAKDGALLFSTNFRKFVLDEESRPPCRIKDISNETLSKDFNRSRKMHHCYLITKL